MLRTLAAVALWTGCVFVAAGCGGGKKLYPVEGVVTIDGQPIEGATVTFGSTEGTASTGLTSASGKFKLLTNGQEGAPAGTYKVTVTKSAIKTSATYDSKDPSKAYQEYMKDNNMKMNQRGQMEMSKPKSEVPDRYATAGAIPDQVIPATGSITIELSSKK